MDSEAVINELLNSVTLKPRGLSCTLNKSFTHSWICNIMRWSFDLLVLYTMKIFQIITDHTIQKKSLRLISPLYSSEKPSRTGKLSSSQQSKNFPKFHSIILQHYFGFPGISISSEPVWVTSKQSVSPSAMRDHSFKWPQVPLQRGFGGRAMVWILAGWRDPSSSCPPFSVLPVDELA